MSDINIEVLEEEEGTGVDVIADVLKGDKGDDGITPTIGANENWFLGNTDTGKPSRGNQGVKGQDGYTPQKGIDYFTQQDIEEIETDVKEDVLDEVYTKSETDTLLEEKADIEDIPDVSSFITKDVNNLTNYTLKTNTGSLIDLEINDTTYVVTLKLKNQDGTIISTDTIDLPLESVVVSGRYDNTTKKVILTLENGSEVDFSVADLVAGLQTEITSSNKLASDLVDDTNSGNKFVTTSEKQTWNNKLDESDLTDYVKNTDYSAEGKGGVIKVNSAFMATSMTASGTLQAVEKTYSQYQNLGNSSFIGKGTFENALTGKQLINQTQLEESQDIQDEEIEKLQTENARLKATLPTTTGEGQDVTLNKTAELEFIKPPLPRGNSEQVQYSGKNEFNKKASHFDGDYASFTELETGVRITATSSGSGTYIWTRFVIKDLSDYVGKTVRCKASIKASANNTPNITIGLCASNGENRTQKASTRTSGELFSFEVPQFSDENTYLYIVFYANAGGSVTSGDYVDYTDVILTIDNSDMAYEPYVGGIASPNPDYPQEITNVTGDVEVKVQNKNRCKSIYETEDLRRFYRALYVDFDIKPNTQYVFSFKTNQNGLAFYPNENIFTNSSAITVSSSDRNIFIGTTKNLENLSSTDHTSNGYAILKNNINLSVAATFEDVQIEENTVATDYVEHKEQVLPLTLGNIELCKIGDYQDYFYKESNKWYLHKEIGKIVYDGSENDWVKSSSTDVDRYMINDNRFLNNSNSLCNYFIKSGVVTDIGKWFNNANLQFGFNYAEPGTTTLAQWKEWLNTHNLIVIQPLATPTDTEITDTILISQLEAINNAISYEEQTNIIGSSNESNPIFSVEAYQSTKLLDTGHTHNNKAVLDGISSSDITNWNNKQNSTDNNLTTINKTITGAINEVDSIAKGANQALVYGDYQTMITAFNTLDDDVYNLGQNIYIITTEVPDLWISGIESTSSTYTYVDDETFANEIATNGYVQVGYYKISALETQKVKLTDYVKNTDYPSSSDAGVIKTGSSYGTSIASSGHLISSVKNYETYSSAGAYMFISKGTLENVLRGYGLIE